MPNARPGRGRAGMAGVLAQAYAEGLKQKSPKEYEREQIKKFRLGPSKPRGVPHMFPQMDQDDWGAGGVKGAGASPYSGVQPVLGGPYPTPGFTAMHGNPDRPAPGYASPYSGVGGGRPIAAPFDAPAGRPGGPGMQVQPAGAGRNFESLMQQYRNASPTEKMRMLRNHPQFRRRLDMLDRGGMVPVDDIPKGWGGGSPV
jgi:hypothetical protein